MNYAPPTAIQIKNTRDVAAENGVKLLVYGGAGAGKTRLCSTAPYPIVFSAESGLLSLRKYELPYIEITDYASLVNAYNWAVGSAESKNYWTICIDSISEIAEVILQHERKSAGRDPRKAYGEMAIQVMDLLRMFRDMRQRHVYFAAKMGRLKDEATGAILWGPLMPGQQLDQQLPYFTDEVFHLASYPDGQGGQIRKMRTQPDNQYQAKDRSGVLLPWEDPDLGSIFDRIMKG